MVPREKRSLLRCNYQYAGHGSFLDFDALRAGDIVLSSHTCSLSSLFIRTLSPGPYSHASVLLAPWTLLEAVRPRVRTRLPKCAISVRVGSDFHTLEPLDSLLNVGVFRIPNLQNWDTSDVSNSLADLASKHGSTDYWIPRLILALRLGRRWRELAQRIVTLGESRNTRAGKLPGPFCSELAAELLKEAEHPCQLPPTPSPNRLARAGLAFVPEAIVSLSGDESAHIDATGVLTKHILRLEAQNRDVEAVVRDLKLSTERAKAQAAALESALNALR